jgi:hypothetical protein
MWGVGGPANAPLRMARIRCCVSAAGLTGGSFAMALLIEFTGLPKEKALIGEMVMAYGEIEFGLVSIITFIFDGDGERAARVLFRVNGEGPRLAVADAIIRPELAKIGLAGKWDNAYGAAKHCKNIRNQYAHCHWQNHLPLGLSFMNLDAMASGRGDNLTVTFEPIDLALIESQHQYFDYTTKLLYFLAGAYQVKRGRLPTHDYEFPKSIPPPPLSNLKALVARMSKTEKT